MRTQLFEYMEELEVWRDIFATPLPVRMKNYRCEAFTSMTCPTTNHESVQWQPTTLTDKPLKLLWMARSQYAGFMIANGQSAI